MGWGGVGGKNERVTPHCMLEKIFWRLWRQVGAKCRPEPLNILATSGGGGGGQGLSPAAPHTVIPTRLALGGTGKGKRLLCHADHFEHLRHAGLMLLCPHFLSSACTFHSFLIHLPTFTCRCVKGMPCLDGTPPGCSKLQHMSPTGQVLTRGSL